jgi:hypothetical protein
LSPFLTRLAFVAAALSLPATLSQAALIHQWAFEEPDGTPAPQALDSVGANHGTFQNMTDANRSADVPVATGSTRSLEFTGGPNFGANDHVTLNSQILFPNNSAFSVALWYKGEDEGANPFVGSTLIGRDANDIFSNIGIFDGKATFAHHNGGWQQLSSTSNVDDNDWHHLAFVHYANQTADIYVDGVREVTAGDATVDNANFPVRLEVLMRGFNQHYTQGLLDDVRVYNHTLSEEEVEALAIVPEPASASLALLAGGAMLVLRRRA